MNYIEVVQVKVQQQASVINIWALEEDSV